MDYSKSGNPKRARDGHNHRAQDLPRRGAPAGQTEAEARKAALLARMKAAAAARKKD